MNISYTKIGDYLLPDLTLKQTKKGNINKYGRMRLAYLKDYKKTLYTSLILTQFQKLPLLFLLSFSMNQDCGNMRIGVRTLGQRQ